MSSVCERYGEVFWRAHHEAWLQSELNQREYGRDFAAKHSEAIFAVHPNIDRIKICRRSK
jgi:hypothetical protein